MIRAYCPCILNVTPKDLVEYEEYAKPLQDACEEFLCFADWMDEEERPYEQFVDEKVEVSKLLQETDTLVDEYGTEVPIVNLKWYYTCVDCGMELDYSLGSSGRCDRCEEDAALEQEAMQEEENMYRYD